MKKGISPVVGVVLLIAIAVVAAVGLYFWGAGMATSQPTTDVPVSITATPIGGGQVLVANLGEVAYNGPLYLIDGTITCNFPIPAGQQIICNVSGVTDPVTGLWGPGSGSVIPLQLDAGGPPGCGDGIWQLDLGEDCDDGNLDDGDCCDSTCQAENLGNTTCGVGVCYNEVVRCVDGVEQSCSAGAATETPEATCDDALDNDCDGDTDCADSDCIGGPDCCDYTKDEWLRAHGGDQDEEATDMDYTADGGYASVGWTTSFGGLDVLVTKYNSSGGIDWAYAYDTGNNDYGRAIEELAGGGYIVVGSRQTFMFGAGDILVMRLNSTGGVDWAKDYGKAGLGFGGSGYGVTETSGGKYLVTGFSYDYAVGNNPHLILIQLNTTGGVDWAKVYGSGGEDDIGYDVLEASDNNFTVAGLTRSYGAGNDEIIMIKVNTTGDVIWAKAYGEATNEIVYRFIEDSNDNYVVSGRKQRVGLGSYYAFAMRTNSTGHVDWTKTYTNATNTWQVIETNDNKYAFAGMTGAGVFGVQAALIHKVDTDGTSLWASTCGGASNDWFRGLWQTGDDRYAAAGYTESFGTGNDVLFVRTNSTGGIPDCGSSASLGALVGVDEMSTTSWTGTPTVTNAMNSWNWTGAPTVIDASGMNVTCPC